MHVLSVNIEEKPCGKSAASRFSTPYGINFQHIVVLTIAKNEPTDNDVYQFF